jgi:predicted  nucleic acid-binding Zn-ribbon protein
MEAKTSMESSIALLVKLQGIDRARDRLQKRLDQVPIKLREHTDAIADLERSIAVQAHVQRVARAEADRAELEVRAGEAKRERYKAQMNAPTLSAREYDVLREQLAGVLADINSHSDIALKAMEAAGAADTLTAELEVQREQAQAAYEAARAKLEGSLGDVRAELARLDAEREAFTPVIPAEALAVYERVRTKHRNALALVEGTIDREAGRIGNDLHCSACYITITSNDAVKVLESKLIQCKSCVRILYVP